MCNYMGHRVAYSDFIRLKKLEKQASVVQSQAAYRSGFEYKDWPIIRPMASCEWGIDLMEWGYLPNYVTTREQANKFRKGYKDANGKFHVPMTTLNAKGEELLLPGKMYREAALNRRCLVIASYFYEWRHIFPIGKKGEVLKTAVKYPYYIGVKDAPYFFMPAIWNRFEDRDTHEIKDTFALCTTEANSVMEQIHNGKKRMPAMLTEDLADEWISDGLSEERITAIATHKITSAELDFHPLPKNFKDLPDPTIKYDYGDILSAIAA